MNDHYKTISKASEGEFKNKGSKFFAYAFPIKTEEEVSTHLDSIKAKHFKARHHCYAYQLGIERDKFRYNDDGEPSGTAGKPIYGQLLSFEVTNIIIIVVRYFGGTKLGVSGLIEAYKTAAKDALLNSEIIDEYLSNKYNLIFDYAEMGTIMNTLKTMDLNIINKEFNVKCTVQIELRKSVETALLKLLKANLLHVSEEYIDDETIVDFCKIIEIDEDA